MNLKPAHPKPKNCEGHLIGQAILWGRPYDFYVTSGHGGEKLTAVVEDGSITLYVFDAKRLAREPVWKYALHLYYNNL